MRDREQMGERGESQMKVTVCGQQGTEFQLPLKPTEQTGEEKVYLAGG